MTSEASPRVVRPATAADLGALVAGNQAMALETEEIELDRGTLERGIRAILNGERSGAYRVIEADGRVVAQLMVTYEWSDWRNRIVWWIQSVYVVPEERRRGHLRALYTSVIDEARAAGAAAVRLYVERGNEGAKAAYAALGMNGDRYEVFEALFDAH